MSKRKIGKRILMGACISMLCACSSDDTNNTGGTSGAATGAAGQDASAAMSGTSGTSGMTMDAQCPQDYLAFSTGPETGLVETDAASGISVRLLEAPNPPERDYNTWKIALTNADGTPATSASISWACSFMSVHNHGANPMGVENLGNGEFSLTKQYLKMFGPWEIQLWIDPTGTAVFAPQDGTVTLMDGKPCVPTVGATTAPSVEFDVCVPRTGG